MARPLDATHHTTYYIVQRARVALHLRRADAARGPEPEPAYYMPSGIGFGISSLHCPLLLVTLPQR